MRALVVSIEGSRAVVLLRGGGMRTVRASEKWCVGQEVTVGSFAAARPVWNLRPVLAPALVFALVLIVVLAGWGRLGGKYIDRTNHNQQLSSGGPEAAASGEPQPVTEPAAEASAEPTATPSPQNEPPHAGLAGVRGDNDDDDDDDDDDNRNRRR